MIDFPRMEALLATNDTVIALMYDFFVGGVPDEQESCYIMRSLLL